MSKGRVWNKGKRNGGGGPVVGSKELAEAKENKKLTLQQQELGSGGSGNVDAVNPIDRVARMNRENWVERPTRIKPENRE
jgi:hypothetical protein